MTRAHTAQVWRFGFWVGVVAFAPVVAAISITLLLYGHLTFQESFIGMGIGFIVGTIGIMETRKWFSAMESNLNSE